jgi:hypothetical protein
MRPSRTVQGGFDTLPCMLTAKALFAAGVGIVIALAAVLHFLGPDAMHALGRILHGGQ